MNRMAWHILSALWIPTLVLLHPGRLPACSTAVFGPAATADGAPMLWKNRDTDVLSNKVVFVQEKPFAFVGLVNASETSGRFVYAGLNAVGFAIFNSVAYNLPPPSAEEMKDLEGQIMSDALRTCRSVDDFQAYLEKNLGAALGSQANFGVFDAAGRAALFEEHNHGFQKMDAAAAPGGYLVNTNFSRSGPKGRGAGNLRFERVSALLAGAPGRVSHRFVLDALARDFGHALVRIPSLSDLEALPGKTPFYLSTEDAVCRACTSAAVVIQGKRKGAHAPSTLWVALGEPICSLAVPLWVEAASVPGPLFEGKDAPLYREAARVRKLLRPFAESDKVKYIDATRLTNRERDGFLPALQKAQQEIYQATADFLGARHTPAELARFQDQTAAQALSALQKIR